MIVLEWLFRHPLVQPVGWALVHFLWQGTAVASLLALLIRTRISRGDPLLRSAEHRYLAGCTALLLMAACPVVTLVLLLPGSDHFLLLHSGGSAFDRDIVGGAVNSRPLAVPSEKVPPPLQGGRRDAATFPRLHPGLLSAAPPGRRTGPAVLDRPLSIPLTTEIPKIRNSVIQSLLPGLVGVWLLGTLLLSVRLVGGWVVVQRLGRRGARPIQGETLAGFAELARRMGIGRPVRLLESVAVPVPTVIGWLGAVVLVPVGALTGLPPQQLEALLAHELAHIRRHDYLVNLLQTVVETVLFYHPAVWWVSQCIRRERENCCDDLVVAVLGDRLTYARALTSLEELGRVPGPLALAATGSGLMPRVRRILGLPPAFAGPSATGVGGMIVITLILAAVLAASAGEPAAPVERATASAAVGVGAGNLSIRGGLKADHQIGLAEQARSAKAVREALLAQVKQVEMAMSQPSQPRAMAASALTADEAKRRRLAEQRAQQRQIKVQEQSYLKELINLRRAEAQVNRVRAEQPRDHTPHQAARQRELAAQAGALKVQATMVEMQLRLLRQMRRKTAQAARRAAAPTQTGRPEQVSAAAASARSAERAKRLRAMTEEVEQRITTLNVEIAADRARLAGFQAVKSRRARRDMSKPAHSEGAIRQRAREEQVEQATIAQLTLLEADWARMEQTRRFLLRRLKADIGTTGRHEIAELPPTGAQETSKKLPANKAANSASGGRAGAVLRIARVAANASTRAAKPGSSNGNGIVKGAPGRSIQDVTVLDLRGMPASQVAQIRSIKDVVVVLLDEKNRNALRNASMEDVAATVVAGPNARVLVEPFLELSRAAVEGMPARQQFILVGVVYFKPDVTPALVNEKFASLNATGVVLASEGVRGALLGRMQITGTSVVMPDDAASVVHSVGSTQITTGYLERLADQSIYVNIGSTEIGADVTESLLAQKIRGYVNIGETTGPKPLLDLLKSRSIANVGAFEAAGEKEKGGG